MKALVWTAPKTMEMQDLPVPQPRPDEVLIQVEYVGICGSELSGYLGHNALRVPPLVMGHEFSGTIVESGADVATANPQLATGQAVTVNPLFCKADSEFRDRGLDHLCPTRQLVGASRPGAYAEYVAVPAETVTPLPTDLSMRRGALTEPVGCAIRIAEHAEDVTGKSCLIIGAGPIGLLALQALRLEGAGQIFIADLDRERLAMGEKYGGKLIDPNQQDVVEAIHAATGGRGIDVAIDAVGATVTREQCIAATVPTGIVILSGLHEEVSTMPVADAIRREVRLQGSFAYSPANFVAAATLLAAGEFDLEPWIVEAPLAEGGAWFDRLIEAPGNVSKVLLRP